MARWLIFVHRIPPRPLYLRAKMRQRLANIGAIAVKNAVYLMPANADSLEDLQWIAQEIVAGGGDAHLFEGDFVEDVAGDAAVARFRGLRNAEYDSLAADAHAAMKAARSAAAASELRTAQTRLAQRFDEIRRIDFFEAERRSHAEQALAAIEARLQKDRKEETRMIKANPELKGRTWVTRPGVKIDRMASSWFILRFVDPKARFRFAEPSTRKNEGEIRFDMVGGEFTHEEDRCTLETLIRRVGPADKGVRVIAEIVHDLDLKDGKFGRPEASGVAMMVQGIIARTENDDERIERALAIFDDLHEGFRTSGRKRK